MRIKAKAVSLILIQHHKACLSGMLIFSYTPPFFLGNFSIAYRSMVRASCWNISEEMLLPPQGHACPPPQHPADRLMNKIVLIINKHLRYFRVLQMAAPDIVEG